MSGVPFGWPVSRVAVRLAPPRGFFFFLSCQHCFRKLNNSFVEHVKEFFSVRRELSYGILFIVMYYVGGCSVEFSAFFHSYYWLLLFGRHTCVMGKDGWSGGELANPFHLWSITASSGHRCIAKGSRWRPSTKRCYFFVVVVVHPFLCVTSNGRSSKQWKMPHLIICSANWNGKCRNNQHHTSVYVFMLSNRIFLCDSYHYIHVQLLLATHTFRRHQQQKQWRRDDESYQPNMDTNNLAIYYTAHTYHR